MKKLFLLSLIAIIVSGASLISFDVIQKNETSVQLAQVSGGSQIAFPGAEGFGRNAQGGRGGQVLFVTNLNDNGPGSLRAALEASGPRTVVFRVGGTITLQSQIRITNPYLTIAGQTAPGGGITITHDGSIGLGLIDILTHDVIVRHIRIRPGPFVLPTPDHLGSCCLDALNIREGARDVIIDHVSVSWASDEIFSIGNVSDITVQWSIISEGLNCSTDNFNITFFLSHSSPTCPQGGTISGGAQLMTISEPWLSQLGGMNITLHHNLYAHNSHRNPKFDGPGHLDFINNVIYDPGWHMSVAGADGATKVNYIGNHIKSGPLTDLYEDRYILFDTGALAVQGGNTTEVYHTDNIVDTVVGEVLSDRTLSLGVVVSPERFSSPWVTEAPANQIQNIVLNDVGANRPQRDSVDSRVVSEVNNRTGLARLNSVGAPNSVNHPNDVGGFPVIANGTPSTDSDNDGMPNSWESANGLNPNNASDRNGDLDGDGFTNLEEYLNSLTSFPGDGVNGSGSSQQQSQSGGTSGSGSQGGPLSGQTNNSVPMISLTTPNNGQVVSGNTTVQATITSENFIERIRFFAGGNLLTTTSGLSPSATWDTTRVPNGPTDITVSVTDVFNQNTSDVIQVIVQNEEEIISESPSLGGEQVAQAPSQNAVTAPVSSGGSRTPSRTQTSPSSSVVFEDVGEGVQKNITGRILNDTFTSIRERATTTVAYADHYVQGVNDSFTLPFFAYIVAGLALAHFLISHRWRAVVALTLLATLLYVLVVAGQKSLALLILLTDLSRDIAPESFTSALLYQVGLLSQLIFAFFVGTFFERGPALLIVFLATLLSFGWFALEIGVFSGLL